MGYVNARINAGHEHIIKSHDSKSTALVRVKPQRITGETQIKDPSLCDLWVNNIHKLEENNLVWYVPALLTVSNPHTSIINNYS